MDNKEHIGLWDCSTEYKPLRRPNSKSLITESNTKHDSQDQNVTENTHSTESVNYNDILNKTNLSVDAKEWFPSSYTPATSQLVQPAQSRLQRIRNNLPEDYNMETSQNKIPFDPVNLDILIQQLIYDPGQFDNLIDNFIAILEPYFDDIHVAIKTAEAVFESALKEPSFRYNAARLCCILDEHYPLFRPRLHILCEKELNSDKQAPGLTLFLAELYMQLHYEAIYGRCLLDSLKKLMSSKTPEDIKSACQALKLTGYSLESNNGESLDEIFDDLQASLPSLQQSLINLVESVFSLRRNNWGRNINTTTTGNSYQEQNGLLTSSSEDDFILYGPDGQEITLEEQEFLCSNLGDEADYLGDESSDPDDLYNPEPEMDKEIQEAFREFVKMGKR